MDLKFDNILNSAFKFAKKYIKDYFKAMLVPISLGFLAGLFLILFMANNSLIFLALLSIPFMCVGFWKGYVITYGLNYAAYFYDKKEERSFFESVKLAQAKEKELAKYVTFCAFIFLVAFLPMFYMFFKMLPLIVQGGASSLMNFASSELIAFIPMFLLNILVGFFLLPFSNFLNQAFFFKRKNETYFDLFLNCFKKINIVGVGLSVFFAIISGVASSFHPLISAFLVLALNLIFYSANTFWYQSRLEIKK